MDHSIKAAGIDTGKSKLDIALSWGDFELQVENDPAGHQQLIAWLSSHGAQRVGIEASGGYEQAVVGALRAEGFCVAVLQPIQVRAFANFRLQRAKNDRIDAALIAQCAAATARIKPAPDPRLQALAEQLTLIEQLEEDIVRCKTRRETFRQPRHRDLMTAEIKRLKALRADEIKALARQVQSQGDLARRLTLIESVPGVGRRTAIALLVRMPELGALSREEVAALAGLAPYDDDSGTRRGQRHVAGGRKRLRKSLYAAALPAAFRWNPALVSLYSRLTSAGKPHKIALVACARKLLIYVNTVVQRDTPWINQLPST